MVLVLMLLLAGCGAVGNAKAPSAFPDPLLPPQILDQYRLERRPEVEGQYAKPGRASLVQQGQVFTIRSGDTIEGSVQVAVFKPNVDVSLPSLRSGIEGDLGSSAAFRTEHFGVVRLRVLQTAEEQLFIWFPPDYNVMELFVMRRKFADARIVVRSLIAHQRTAPPGSDGPPIGSPGPPGAPGGSR